MNSTRFKISDSFVNVHRFINIVTFTCVVILSSLNFGYTDILYLFTDMFIRKITMHILCKVELRNLFRDTILEIWKLR